MMRIKMFLTFLNKFESIWEENVKKPVILFIVLLLAAAFLSACGCPVNLTDPPAGAMEKTVTPAPEQSVPMHTSPTGISSDGLIVTADSFGKLP